jgi:tetratricopeptide (TPR) repeat protein
MEGSLGKGDHQGTVTLARLFAEQGHWEKSVEIYRRLLRQDPDRQDLARALDEAEAALRASGPTSAQALAPLLQQWIDLLLTYDRLRKLHRFKARV